jgi:hypothetical protein
MNVPCKFVVLSAAMFTGIAAAYADPVRLSDDGTAAPQLAALAPAGASPNAVALPDLTVYAPESQPYASGFSPRGGSANTVRAAHFHVWAGYDASVALHPYTSNIGPGPEAAPIQPSRYERLPFTDR